MSKDNYGDMIVSNCCGASVFMNNSCSGCGNKCETIKLKEWRRNGNLSQNK